MSKKLKIKNSYNLFELMEMFLKYKSACGLTERTLETYKTHFNSFKQYSDGSTDMEKLKFQILNFLESKNNMSPYTYNTALKELKCFFSWCVMQGYLENSPIKVLGIIRKKEPYKEVSIPPEDMQKFISTIRKEYYCEYRDYVIICLMIDTGIRPAECFKLQNENVDYKNNCIMITEDVSKTNTRRFLPVSKSVISLISDLVKYVPSEWNTNLIFTSNTGTPLTSRTFSKRMKIYSNRSGVKITAYDIRHSFATQFLENNGELFCLGKIMGHSNIRTTQRYVYSKQEFITAQHSMATPLNKVMRNKKLVLRR